MKRSLIVFIIFAVAGFLVGAIFPKKDIACTMMWCPCEGVVGERICNTCFFSDYLFATGIINISRRCRASEIIVCENDKVVDSKIDMENKKCSIELSVFGFNLKNLWANPETAVSSKVKPKSIGE